MSLIIIAGRASSSCRTSSMLARTLTRHPLPVAERTRQLRTVPTTDNLERGVLPQQHPPLRLPNCPRRPPWSLLSAATLKVPALR
eukprot:scaffold44_cov411-Prasinococcus_capsulatus_cf.AAC.54